MTIQQILIKYWGFNSFRPLQEDIINSVLDGNDTLALLPTGGGKSICFQIPGLAKEGICIVISPLIALMKDQVGNLNKRGIKAYAIYSGMHKKEIDLILENCAYGNTKFLYVSPERLDTKLLRERIKKMNVNLLAIDESHCISQWGYDFRPQYLKIAEIRDFLPTTPVMALTATATPEVVTDIQDKLEFKNPRIFQKSFERRNLTYTVFYEEDKLGRILRIINNVKGSGIIYARNRRKTRELAEFLYKNKISADYYHAGLSPEVRDTTQDAWIKGKRRVIVATNAFGMGIDKPDVRFVVHVDLPDSLEAYFQEAGRGGRDEEKAYAVLLYDNNDISNAEKSLKQSYPDLKIIRNVYKALGNHYQLAVGSGKNLSFDFNISEFSKKFNFDTPTVYNSLKLLEKDGYLILSNTFNNPSKINFGVNKDYLYRFQVKNAYYDNFIKLILRNYTGVFTSFIKIDENELARKSKLDTNKVIKLLKELANLGVITYVQKKTKPQLIFVCERLDTKDIVFSKMNYQDRKNAAVVRQNAVINYASDVSHCRSQILLSYFGEKKSKRCGSCNVCLERNKADLSKFEFDTILNKIKPLLSEKEYTINELVDKSHGISEEKIIKVISWLVDNNKIEHFENKIRWVRKNK